MAPVHCPDTADAFCPDTAVTVADRYPAPRPTTTAALCTSAAVDAAVPVLRHFARNAARRWAMPADTVDTLSLVVTELVTNVVLHSDSPHLTVLITHHGDEVRIEVKDAGTWRTRTSPRRVPEDDDATCGRGLDLVAYCCTWWLALTGPIGTRVIASLPVTPPTT
ncbi:ATP-binding protein [Streptacidiphilus neutrinimicus]|uniref:ATP-binding protein n=1 Tax=Streptacidiphilus neutrinimicus TaxID=105420 RepID=UPI0005A75727|nr:ATP-binding protein [Streptacidiphilus neutrinimicus]